MQTGRAIRPRDYVWPNATRAQATRAQTLRPPADVDDSRDSPALGEAQALGCGEGRLSLGPGDRRASEHRPEGSRPGSRWGLSALAALPAARWGDGLLVPTCAAACGLSGCFRSGDSPRR